jgi:hypothetical protein
MVDQLLNQRCDGSDLAGTALEQLKKNCSRTFGAAEADLGRRQLGTYVLICPFASNGPSPPPALPNQRPHLFLNALGFEKGDLFCCGDFPGSEVAFLVAT